MRIPGNEQIYIFTVFSTRTFLAAKKKPFLILHSDIYRGHKYQNIKKSETALLSQLVHFQRKEDCFY